jgi:general stress protein 26
MVATTYQHDAPSTAEHRAKLREILEDAGTVMLMTRTHGTSDLHVRPMASVRVDDDGTMYLITSVKTTKVAEIQADPRVDVVFQSKTRFATVSGTARVHTDRALVNQLWSESWKIWFPEGKDDPDIVILVINPDRGEYWDQSGTAGISFLYRAAKAYFTGKEIEVNGESHGKVRM